MPEFKKIENVLDGVLVEKFFIDNKEVDESTYYSLLEDRMGILQHPKININKNNKDIENTENKKASYSKSELDELDDLEELEQKQVEYIQRLLELVQDNPDEAFDALYNEFMYQYKLGYLVGQLDINDTYFKAMRQNYRAVRDKIEDLADEYDGENEQ